MSFLNELSYGPAAKVNSRASASCGSPAGRVTGNDPTLRRRLRNEERASLFPVHGASSFLVLVCSIADYHMIVNIFLMKIFFNLLIVSEGQRTGGDRRAGRRRTRSI